MIHLLFILSTLSTSHSFQVTEIRQDPPPFQGLTMENSSMTLIARSSDPWFLSDLSWNGSLLCRVQSESRSCVRKGSKNSQKFKNSRGGEGSDCNFRFSFLWFFGNFPLVVTTARMTDTGLEWVWLRRRLTPQVWGSWSPGYRAVRLGSGVWAWAGYWPTSPWSQTPGKDHS